MHIKYQCENVVEVRVDIDKFGIPIHYGALWTRPHRSIATKCSNDKTQHNSPSSSLDTRTVTARHTSSSVIRGTETSREEEEEEKKVRQHGGKIKRDLWTHTTTYTHAMLKNLAV